MKRKPISTRTRFEIFKRDAFTCQYCGAKPPAVVLHVDHVLAVADGGTADHSNLVTACENCNLGKSDKPLSSKPESLATAQNREREKFEQLREYNAWLSERSQQTEQWFNEISAVWTEMDGRDPAEWRIAGNREASVRMFLKFLPCAEIIDALHITRGRMIYAEASSLKFHRYFCGVCWRKIKGDGNAPTVS